MRRNCTLPILGPLAFSMLCALPACSGDDPATTAAGGVRPGGAVGDDETSHVELVTPRFAGAGTSGSAASIGVGVDTVGCGPDGPVDSPSDDLAQDAVVTIVCFYGDDETPAASIEWVVETAEDDELVHIRLTLDPTFADNSYGEDQVGWGEDGAKDHKLKDLVGSDHAQMQLTDGDGEVVLEFKVDYISEDDSAPSGYATQGVDGGDGKMITGDRDAVVAVSTSLDRNFNLCGLDEYQESSPPTDEDLSTSVQAPDWVYRIVYDVWVERSAFGDAGFGEALIEKVHASPSKAGENSVEVTPDDCPPDWCRDPDGCDGRTNPPCNPLDDGCGGDGDPPDDDEDCNPLDDGCGSGGEPPPVGMPLDCEDTPEGCESPD
jgi:hypothetical protein